MKCFVAAVTSRTSYPKPVTALAVAGFLSLMATLVTSANAVDGLTLKDGLEFRYDASQIDAGATETEKTDDGEVTRVKSWPDSSGNDRHASQAETSARPQLVKVGDSQVVRFDGIDDYLRLTGVDRSVD